MNIARGHQGALGFTLLECLAYMVVLVVVLTLAVGAFYRVGVNSRHLGRNVTDIVRALQAGERWREDIRSAHGPIQWVQSGDEKVLRVPQAKGTAAQYVWRGETVYRQAGSNAAWQPWLPGVRNSRMGLDPRQRVAAWRWEIELQGTRKTARVRPLFTFYAVPPSAKTP